MRQYIAFVSIIVTIQYIAIALIETIARQYTFDIAKLTKQWKLQCKQGKLKENQELQVTTTGQQFLRKQQFVCMKDNNTFSYFITFSYPFVKLTIIQSYLTGVKRN